MSCIKIYIQFYKFTVLNKFQFNNDFNESIWNMKRSVDDIHTFDRAGKGSQIKKKKKIQGTTVYFTAENTTKDNTQVSSLVEKTINEEKNTNRQTNSLSAG